MNLLAIDIGNTSIKFGLFLEGVLEPVISISGTDEPALRETLRKEWAKVPISTISTEGKKNGVILVSSVKNEWTELLGGIVQEELNEQIKEIGIEKDIPFPIKAAVEFPAEVGADRILSAAAAFIVEGDAVVVADFGTAVTIDLVDEHGEFIGGIIAPGIETMLNSMSKQAEKLPEIKFEKPLMPYGQNTKEAMACGAYYSAIGLLEFTVRKYSDEIGKWPRTIITGGHGQLIKDGCDFAEVYVPNLVIQGIALAYRVYLDDLGENA